MRAIRRALKFKRICLLACMACLLVVSTPEKMAAQSYSDAGYTSFMGFNLPTCVLEVWEYGYMTTPDCQAAASSDPSFTATWDVLWGMMWSIVQTWSYPFNALASWF